MVSVGIAFSKWHEPLEHRGFWVNHKLILWRKITILRLEIWGHFVYYVVTWGVQYRDGTKHLRWCTSLFSNVGLSRIRVTPPPRSIQVSSKNSVYQPPIMHCRYHLALGYQCWKLVWFGGMHLLSLRMINLNISKSLELNQCVSGWAVVYSI